MKIVFLNTSEDKGGAAIAANRLMKTLKRYNVKVKTIVRDKQSDDPDVISVNTYFGATKINHIRFLWERLSIFLQNKFCKENLFAVSIANTGTDISRHPEIKDADIIHIHWINQGFLSISDINKLLRTNKPIVWTMHDMWPCTGICHHARECTNFTKECGNCFFLDSKRKNDLSKKIFLKKKKFFFSNCNITFVGCSSWLANKAKISNLSKNNQIFSIPNPIDTTFYDISDKNLSRKQLNLPEDKKLILFGAANISDRRKGIYYLIDAIKIIKEQNTSLGEQLCLVAFGKAKEDFKNLINIPVYSMGYLTDSKKIVSLYNAVDLFITPSLEENLPNTIMESMACGTPCVGFDIGGIPEMIDHKQNGYVVKYKDAEDLSTGIDWVLNKANYKDLSISARQKVVNNYSEDIVANQYLKIYNSLLY